MRRIPLLLALIVGILACAPTHALAQDAPPKAVAAQDACDPADPSCDDDLSSIVSIVPADPATCPYGGIIFTWLGTPMPVCSGAPGTPAPAPAPAVGYDCAGKPVTPGVPVSICQGTPAGQMPAYLPAPVQTQCGPSRRIINKLFSRYHEGQSVFVTIGNDPKPRRMRVPEDDVLRFNLTGRACGLYAIIIRAKGFHPVKLLFIAGPHGSVSGWNVDTR